jgi:hypothetical protein
MVYDNWTVGGVVVPHVRAVSKDQSNRTIKLSCSALRENTSPNDPRSEIAMFEAMASDVVTNTQLMNGGSCLQTCNGDPVILSDGVDSWVAALERPQIDEGSVSFKRIDYELLLHYESFGRPITYTAMGTFDPDTPTEDDTIIPSDQGATKRYLAPFCGFDNILYYRYTNETNPEEMDCQVIGKMVITESRPVNKLNLYCSIASPVSGVSAFVEVSESPANTTQRVYLTPGRYEPLSFNLTNASVITITSDNNTTVSGRSVLIQWVEVTYE